MPIRCNVISCALAALAAVALFATPLLRADSIGVTVTASGVFETNGVFPGSGNCTSSYPNCRSSQTATGLTSASQIVADSGTTAFDTNPAGTTSSYFASVSATEGHIGISLSADSEGIGYSVATASGTWNDTFTISSSSLAMGAPVILVASVGIVAEFVAVGYGSASIQACMNDGFGPQFCTYGNQQNHGTETLPTLPVTVTRQFTGYVGETTSISGQAEGVVGSNAYADSGTGSTSWSLLATNSAHFSITPLDGEDVRLTTGSGCSITNGYGCDPLPTSETPEPPTVWLFAAGLLGLAWTLRRRAAAGAV